MRTSPLQDVAPIPGFANTFNGESMMKLHNLAVKQVCQIPCL